MEVVLPEVGLMTCVKEGFVWGTGGWGGGGEKETEVDGKCRLDISEYADQMKSGILTYLALCQLSHRLFVRNL